jgi:hypothetical protein
MSNVVETSFNAISMEDPSASLGMTPQNIMLNSYGKTLILRSILCVNLLRQKAARLLQ